MHFPSHLTSVNMTIEILLKYFRASSVSPRSSLTALIFKSFYFEASVKWTVWSISFPSSANCSNSEGSSLVNGFAVVPAICQHHFHRLPEILHFLQDLQFHFMIGTEFTVHYNLLNLQFLPNPSTKRLTEQDGGSKHYLFTIEQGFSSGDNFALHGTFVNAWRHFRLSQLARGEGSATGPWWVEDRYAAKLSPTMHRTDPTTKNYTVQNVSSVNAEKLCPKRMLPGN